MPLFRCLIRGENFPGVLFGQAEPVGFYTARFVHAGSEAEAETLAVAMLRDDPGLQCAPEHRTQDARVYVEEIDALPDDADQVPGSGFTFYLMGT